MMNAPQDAAVRIPAVLPVIQPGDATIRDVLEKYAEMTRGGVCRVCIAWMTVDGLALLNDLCARHDVRLTSIIVGINRQGTGARAMRVCLKILEQYDGTLHYYLDGNLSGPIFHPKIWLFQSATFRAAVVGSANLTREALLNNFEACIALSDGPTRNDASAALDELFESTESLLRSDYTNSVDASKIRWLLDIGAIPDVCDTAARDDADDLLNNDVDRLIGLGHPRMRQAFRPMTQLPDIEDATKPPRIVNDTQPHGTRLRFVRYFGLSEANRVQKYFDLGVPAGTLELNISMGDATQERMWRYPDRFTYNQSSTAREWSPRVRLITRAGDAKISTVIPSARLWTRIRGGRQTEVRFRFANTRAVRDVFPRDIEELTLVVIDQVEDDSSVDYEVQLISRNDPAYKALAPTGDRNYEYRFF